MSEIVQDGHNRPLSFEEVQLPLFDGAQHTDTDGAQHRALAVPPDVRSMLSPLIAAPGAQSS